MEDNPAWYKTWFDTPFYHTLYQDRNIAEAQSFLKELIKEIPILPSHSILDIACGRGRHALFLSELGYDVTGIDLSPNSIAYAQQEAKNKALNASFGVHDMRTGLNTQVDMVLTLFTSIGYFDDLQDNTRAIQAFYDNLVPGGVAVIDFLHVSQIQKHLVSDEVVTKGGIKFTLKRSFKNDWIKKDISFSHEGKAYTFTERVRGLTRIDFEKICSAVGFHITKVFGNYSLKPFDAETAERLILVLQK